MEEVLVPTGLKSTFLARVNCIPGWLMLCGSRWVAVTILRYSKRLSRHNRLHSGYSLVLRGFVQESGWKLLKTLAAQMPWNRHAMRWRRDSRRNGTSSDADSSNTMMLEMTMTGTWHAAEFIGQMAESFMQLMSGFFALAPLVPRTRQPRPAQKASTHTVFCTCRRLPCIGCMPTFLQARQVS